MSEGYRQIKSYEDRLTRELHESPLTIPDSIDPIWAEIQEELNKFKEEICLNYYSEGPHNLVSGTINLINRIISDSEKGKPINTLVFLDKSARLAGHIFRIMWGALDDENKIPNEVKKPKIKFINVGRSENHKHEADRALQLASEVFPQSDMDGGVLVVDEIISSGGSVRRAAKSLDDIYDITAESIANYHRLPKWYFDDEFKGIKDPNLPKKIYTYFEKMDENFYSMLKEAASWDNATFTELLKEAENLTVIQFIKKYYNEFNSNIFKLISFQQEINSLLAQFSRRNIISYFKTAGGFLGLSPRKYNDDSKSIYKSSLKYRKFLTRMVELSVPHVNLSE